MLHFHEQTAKKEAGPARQFPNHKNGPVQHPLRSTILVETKSNVDFAVSSSTHVANSRNIPALEHSCQQVQLALGRTLVRGRRKSLQFHMPDPTKLRTFAIAKYVCYAVET